MRQPDYLDSVDPEELVEHEIYSFSNVQLCQQFRNTKPMQLAEPSHFGVGLTPFCGHGVRRLVPSE